MLLWDPFKNHLTNANEENMPVKRISEHSKPFWTTNLMHLSKIVQAAKIKSQRHSTPQNKANYDHAKDTFSDELVKTKNIWIRNKLENLNVRESQTFWKNYRRTLTGDTTELMGNLEENGVLYADTTSKENILFDSFFTGNHMRGANFNKNFDQEIELLYKNILSQDKDGNTSLKSKATNVSSRSMNTADFDILNQPIGLEEVYASLKHQKTTVKTFDGNNFHPKMLKNLPHIAVKILHKCFNLCQNSGNWVWDVSKVVFIKKDGKPNYLKISAFRPISISSYVGKLLERIIEQRIRAHCDLEGILDDEQEGFRSTRNTTRYLYKLIANIKEAQRKKFTVFLLCIDFEKAFDSIWLKGLIAKLHKWNIQGNLLRLLNSFLFNRQVKLIINKQIGKVRKCGEYGLPQGSVLSPLLFMMFIRI